ncbi:hypothetical protein GH714_028618 [Hevea brasiliensis]|uniref:Retrotransposon gag domain-containing protein n=1 Tax=Hevea brasiliensis TaxID=3981 RepID=A0A6A6M4J4_HEVBR|nr:hypothetical protein GH714_028618 [Hevea brasiliensis]
MIKALLAGLSLQNMELASGKGSDGSASNQNVSSHKIRQSWGNSTKLEFPRFSGEGLEGWLLRVDYFFEVANVAADDRVKMAALHLEDLRNLKQVSSLQDYLDAFDEIYPKAGIREDQALSFFLSGLVDELQMPVRMFKPSTLAEAYSLARLQEITVAAIQNKPKPSVKPASYNYLPLSRNSDYENKRGVWEKNLHVLVDTGSTHNFLSTKMASKLKCELQKAAGISVEVANGQQLQCEGFCKNFTWSMQGLEFHAEVYVLALDNYDLILGAQWLSTLGEILWNFQTMMMTFKRESMLCVLQGETKKKLSKELNSLMTCLNDDGLFHVDGREATAICIQ